MQLLTTNVFSLRGIQWGTLCLHCSEHRNATETEGNAHFHSKGQSVKTETNRHKLNKRNWFNLFMLSDLFMQAFGWCFLVKFYFSIFPLHPDPTASFFFSCTESVRCSMTFLIIYTCFCASTERGLFNSWETGLQTALYLHLLLNHYPMLQVSALCLLLSL